MKTLFFSSSLSITWNTYERGKAAVDNRCQMNKSFLFSVKHNSQRIQWAFCYKIIKNVLRLGGCTSIKLEKTPAARDKWTTQGVRMNKFSFSHQDHIQPSSIAEDDIRTLHTQAFSPFMFLILICIFKCLYFCCKIWLLMIGHTPWTL